MPPSLPTQPPLAGQTRIADKGSPPRGRAPWIGLLALTLAFTLFSYIRTEGTIFADAVEYIERAFAFVREERLVDAKQLRSAGITLLHVPALLISKYLGQWFGLDDTRWVLAYAAMIHVLITCLFVIATVYFGRALAAYLGRSESEARNVGWFAGLVALGSPTLLQFSAIPMADIGAAAGLAYGLKCAFLQPNTAGNGARAGLGFGLAILAAFKTIPVVAVSAAVTIFVRILLPGEPRADGAPTPFGERFRSTFKFAAAGTLVLAALMTVQCAFDQAAYGTFGIGLRNYVLANAGPGLGALFYKMGLIELGRTVYHAGINSIDLTALEQVSPDISDIHQRSPANWYFENFGDFAPLWTIPIFVFGMAVAAIGAWLVKVPSMRGRFARAISVSAPWAAAGALILVTTVKGTKEMRIWLPLLPAFAAYSALGLSTFAGRADAIGARLRSALVAGVLIALPIHGVVTLTSFTSTAMSSLAQAVKWLNSYEPLRLKSADGDRPVVGSSYHWSALFRSAPHLELIKLTNQPDGSFSHLKTPEERERTLEEIRGLDAFIVHTSLLRIDGFNGAPETAWTRELVQALSETFHVAAAFWDRESDERLFGPILVLVRHELQGQSRRMLTSVGHANPRSDDTPIMRMERPLSDIVEQVELEDAQAWWLPGDDLLWVEFELDQTGPKIIADYVMLLRTTDPKSDRGAGALRRPSWNKKRAADLGTGTRWTEGFVLAPYQGSVQSDDPTPPLPAGSPVRLWFDLVTVDRNPEGQLVPTGRLEPLDPRWRGREAGEVEPEREHLNYRTGVTNDGYRYTGDFGHVLLGQVAPPDPDSDPEVEKQGSGNVLRVEAAFRSQ